MQAIRAQRETDTQTSKGPTTAILIREREKVMKSKKRITRLEPADLVHQSHLREELPGEIQQTIGEAQAEDTPAKKRILGTREGPRQRGLLQQIRAEIQIQVTFDRHLSITQPRIGFTRPPKEAVMLRKSHQRHERT